MKQPNDPDPNYIMLIGDQPMTCPQCGARTEFDVLEGGERELHTCLNHECRYCFYAEPDEDYDDDNDYE